jgi:hypothetical protein
LFPFVTCTFYDKFFTQARSNSAAYTHTCERCGVDVYLKTRNKGGRCYTVSNCHRENGQKCGETPMKECTAIPKLD